MLPAETAAMSSASIIDLWTVYAALIMFPLLLAIGVGMGLYRLFRH